MARNWRQRLDELRRRGEAKAKAKAKARAKTKARPNQPAPEEPAFGSLGNPIRLDSGERVADVRRREAEARERANRPAPHVPGLGNLGPQVHPWVTPKRRGDAPGGPGPPALRRGMAPRGPPGPGAIVIDLEAEDAPVHSRDRAGRKSRFGFPGVKDEVIDLEALVKGETSSSSGNRDGRKVRFAPPGPVKEAIDVRARVPANKAAVRPGRQLGRKTPRAPPGPAEQVIDINAAKGSSSSRPGLGDADSEIARAARERARQLERDILGDFAGGPRDTGARQRAGRRGVQVHSIRPIPLRFEQRLNEEVGNEKEGLSQAVVDYYKNEMMRRDSRNVAGRFGQPSLVEEVLRENALERLRGQAGPGWRPVRELGEGGQGGVTLWEMNRPDGSVLQLATKDMPFEYAFFGDYNNEGNMTRRLNEMGCENVLRVLEWAVLEKPKPRFRIAYEVAEYGDLQDLITWYTNHRLILPEHFIWHVWHSLANALTYQALGHNESADPLPEWEEIVHGDIKPPNTLLCAPDPNAPSTPHAQYPAVKLADYGCAFTIPLDRPDVRAFKSTYAYGTPGYQAPEVENADEEEDEDIPYSQHGPHTDVWSLACAVRAMFYPFYRVRDGSRLGKPVFDPYSGRLEQLIQACLREDGRARPRPYDLFVETGGEVRSGREVFEAGVRTAENGGVDHGIYPDKVLVGKEEQRRFETDMAYREAYKKVNLKWVYERRPQPPRARGDGGAGGNDDDGPSRRGKKKDREDSPENELARRKRAYLAAFHGDDEEEW